MNQIDTNSSFKKTQRTTTFANFNTDYPITKKKLPEDFAEKILNLELDVEDENVTMITVNALLELYAVFSY